MADDIPALRKDINFLYTHLKLPLPVGTTPPVPPAVKPLTITSVTIPSQGAATINWAPDSTRKVATLVVDRDGVDSGGGGAWSETVANDVRQYTFEKLVSGSTYKLRVKATYTTGAAEEATKSVTVSGTAPAPGPTPTPPPTGTGTGWLSGVADGLSAINGWSGFRGEPLTYARVWADADDNNMLGMYAMNDVTGSGYSGVLEVACGGPSDWGSAASGGFDGMWRQQCQKMFGYYRGLKRLDIAMAHEFNGNWYRWSVSGGEQANFKKAYERFYNIVQEELVAKGKNAKVVLSCNSDTVADWTWSNGLPNVAHFDYLGCDYYNMWPVVTTQSAWDGFKNNTKGDTPRGIQAWLDRAKNIGKPITFPEWGNSPHDDQQPLDVPLFFENMRNIFAANAPADPYKPGAGQIAGEAYFNPWDLTRIFPDAPRLPNSRAKYVSLRWGSV
jgi:hypothetical protein